MLRGDAILRIGTLLQKDSKANQPSPRCPDGEQHDLPMGADAASGYTSKPFAPKFVSTTAVKKPKDAGNTLKPFATPLEPTSQVAESRAQAEQIQHKEHNAGDMPRRYTLSQLTRQQPLIWSRKLEMLSSYQSTSPLIRHFRQHTRCIGRGHCPEEHKGIHNSRELHSSWWRLSTGC